MSIHAVALTTRAGLLIDFIDVSISLHNKKSVDEKVASITLEHSISEGVQELLRKKIGTVSSELIGNIIGTRATDMINGIHNTNGTYDSLQGNSPLIYRVEGRIDSKELEADLDF
ncbi:hypothetical protein IDAT_12890 [Pseudidiomarina atlantica]|uniref:Uncharacterized protein n=1 Tax=Pseudidiomarina atlantica TaxID=1517416 RepID=A0A094IPJ8_9GAMM|nr:hypothetical protein [Pseudidiomarina atlantica]KFZ27764.1 hypothetical protein IDAT_12890 [Pseudidiomarina atlantica]